MRGAEPSGLPVGDLAPWQLGVEQVTINLETPSVALAIGAHPDDIEFGCGATLARWAARGAEIHHLVLTDGSKGTWDADEDRAALIATRRREQRSAAAVLGGGDVHFLDWVDGELAAGPQARRQVCEVIRLVRPEVVLGHDPWRRYRLHPDHRNAGWLTVDAIVAARDPLFFPDLHLSAHRPSSLLLWEADLANHVEEATGFEATKAEALLAHRSQHVTTMGFAAGARSGSYGSSAVPGTLAAGATRSEQVDEVELFEEKVRRQLASHGTLAGLATGEAFRRIEPL